MGLPRRLRHHAVHGRHRREPAPAAEPAVLLRVAEHLRRRPAARARSPPASRACRRSIARRAQVRAWDPNLRPQFTQQWNLFAEYLLGSRSSINIGYVGNKSSHLVTPIEGNQPLPGVGDPSTWAPLQQRRPLFRVQPGDHRHQHDGVARAQRLPRAADDVQAAPVARARLRRQLHAEPRQLEQPRLLRLGRRRRRGRVSGQQLRHRGQLRPGVLRRQAHLLDGRQLPGAVRSGPAVRHDDEQAARRWLADGRRASPSRRTPGIPITVQDSEPASLQAHAFGGMAEPDRRSEGRRTRRSNVAESRCVRIAGARHVRQRRRGHPARAELLERGLLVSKRFVTFGRQYLQVRGETFNLLNHPNFGPPDRNIQSQTFGTITRRLVMPG